MIEAGDIVLLYRKKYNGPFKYLVTRAILFFTTAWWKRESTSKVYHAELAVGRISTSEFTVATMEPPEYRYKDRSYKRKIIFRPAMLKSAVVRNTLMEYLNKKLGAKYDFFRIPLMLLNWVFRTTFFTDHYKNGERDICSEAVARFYERWLGRPCSDVEPNSTTPDDIYDFCKTHPDLFSVVYDWRNE